MKPFIFFVILLAGCASSGFLTPLPAADNGQYFFEKPGQPAVLVVHGLSATPWEVLGVSLYLSEHNFTVLTPVLEGHGRRPVDLEATTWMDWYANANDSYTRLSNDYDKVFVVGVSTGGGLAVQLAKEHDLAGVVTIGAPLVLRDERVQYVGILHHFWRWSERELRPGEENHYYRLLPTKSVYEMYKLVEVTKVDAPAVTEPILIIQSRDDATVDPESAQMLHDIIGSDDKELLYIEGVSHTVVRDDTHGTALAAMKTFFQEH